MIGASGAISGVLGAYLLLYPYARVLIFLPFRIFSQVIRLPAFWVLWFWFIFELMSLHAFGGAARGRGVDRPRQWLRGRHGAHPDLQTP